MDRGSPAYWVTVRKVGEKGDPVDLSDRVLSFSFEDNENKADQLKITVDNFDLANFDDPIWAHGNIVQFSFGYASHMSPVREGVIRKVTGGTTLSVEAHSKDVIMDRVPQRISYDNATRSEVAAIIAERNGYRQEELKVDPSSERYEVITQNNLTDAQMLRKLAHLEGYEFFVDFDGLHWHARDLEQAPIRELIYYSDPGAGDIKSFNVDNDITRKPGRVRVKSRDPETGEMITATADNATDADRAILQEVKAVEELTIGVDPETLELLVGSRAIPPTQPVVHEVDVPSNAQTQGEADAEAKRRFRKASQRAVKMSLTIIGDPSILAKSVVQISNMGTRLSGKYYVKTASSKLSATGDGYEQSLKLITDGYQRRYGSGSGGGTKTDVGVGALSAAIQAVATAAQNIENGPILAQAGNIVSLGVSIAKSGSLNKTQLSQLAGMATNAGSAAKTQSARSANPERTNLAAVQSTMIRLAGVAKRMANQEDVAAKGKLNTKDVADARELQQRVVVDPETLESKTVYVEARSRGKK